MSQVIDGKLLVNRSVGAASINVDEEIVVSASGGSIHSTGKSGIDTATSGFFLGNQTGSTTPVFEIGNDEQYIRWDGTKLAIGGNIVTTGNVRSIDSSIVSFRTYTLNGNGNRIDATLGADQGANTAVTDTRDPRGQNKYYWTPADDEDGSAGSPYVFENFLLAPNSVGRTLEPYVLNTVQDAITDAVAETVPTSEFTAEYQIVGETQSMFPNGSGNSMYDGGDMYEASQTTSGWNVIDGSVSFAKSVYVDFRWTYTGSDTVGSMRFISYAGGKTEDHSVSISSTGGTSVPLDNIFENIESVQCTPQYSSSAIATGANAEISTDLGEATVRAYNSSTETSGMDVYITVRGY